MRQALHIFRKDVRYLWREICLVLAMAAIFAWSRPEAIGLLLFPAAGYLIARLVHAEALPGDRQFWITRPYRWQSLLAAKLLFILAFVNLPILLAQWWIVAIRAFPFSSYLPGLLWSQLLMILCVSLPIAALAATTSGLVSFVFCSLILVGIWFTLTFTRILIVGTIAPDSWPRGIGWIRATLIGVGLGTIVFSILYLQYRRRKTLISRAIGVASLAALIATAWYLPWGAGWALQSRLSKQAVDDSLVQIATDPAAVRFQPLQARTWANIDVDVPIAVGRVPDGTHLETDSLAITIQGSDGAIWKSEVGSVRRGADKAGRMMLDVTSKVGGRFFNQERGKQVAIHGSLFMTLFAHARERAITLSDTPVNALDGLQCFLDPFEQMVCLSAFRWPAKLVYGKFGTEMSPLRAMISYSPFPSDLALNPIESNWAPSAPRTSNDVTIVVMEPVAHIRRDFEMRGVQVIERRGPPPWR